MGKNADHCTPDRATLLARVALAAGLLSVALTIVYGDMATAGIHAVIRHAEWQGYALWADVAHFAAFCFAMTAVGLSVGAQIVRWRAPLPSGYGCLTLFIGILALLFSFICV